MVSLKKPAKCISVSNRATAMYVLARTDAFTTGSGLCLSRYPIPLSSPFLWRERPASTWDGFTSKTGSSRHRRRGSSAFWSRHSLIPLHLPKNCSNSDLQSNYYKAKADAGTASAFSIFIRLSLRRPWQPSSPPRRTPTRHTPNSRVLTADAIGIGDKDGQHAEHRQNPAVPHVGQKLCGAHGHAAGHGGQTSCSQQLGTQGIRPWNTQENTSSSDAVRRGSTLYCRLISRATLPLTMMATVLLAVAQSARDTSAEMPTGRTCCPSSSG